MPFNWFGGIYKDEKNFFANFAVDATRLKDIMTELKMPDEQWQAFINDKQGAIVGQKLVTLYGFTPGQRITLKSPIYNQSVEFIIREFAPAAMRRPCSFTTTTSTSLCRIGLRTR
jgi:putative ABC transport system permease protein